MNLLEHIRDQEKFWSLVDIQGDDECWFWQRGMTLGYGEFFLLGGDHNSRPLRSNIAAYLFSKTNGLIVSPILHLCNNRSCCNPAHLYHGDKKQNSHDQFKAGTRDTISMYQVHCIRELAKAGISQKALTKIFNLNKGQCSRIVNLKTWAWLNLEFLLSKIQAIKKDLVVYSKLLRAARAVPECHGWRQGSLSKASFLSGKKRNQSIP